MQLGVFAHDCDESTRRCPAPGKDILEARAHADCRRTEGVESASRGAEEKDRRGADTVCFAKTAACAYLSGAFAKLPGTT
jgi:hypothetical protein